MPSSLAISGASSAPMRKATIDPALPSTAWRKQGRELAQELMRQDERQAILARFRENGGKAIGREMLELVGIKREVAALDARRMSARASAACAKAVARNAPRRCVGASPSLPLDEIDDQHLAAIHDGADIDGALDLAQHVADRGRREQRADLVLDRGHGFGGEAFAVCANSCLPEGAHDWIASSAPSRRRAIVLIGQKAGQTQAGSSPERRGAVCRALVRMYSSRGPHEMPQMCWKAATMCAATRGR